MREVTEWIRVPLPPEVSEVRWRRNDAACAFETEIVWESLGPARHIDVKALAFHMAPSKGAA